MERGITIMDRYAGFLGIEVLDYGHGEAKAKLQIGENHLNSHGNVHGGAIFSLADTAFALASNSRDGLAMAINVNIAYFKAKSSGLLYAAAREVSLKSRLATYVVDITDEEGTAIALFQGTVYRRVHNQPV